MTDTEINEAVAGKLFGAGRPIPTRINYCKRIEEAWKLVDYCNKKGYRVTMEQGVVGPHKCAVSIVWEDHAKDWFKETDSVPMAICLAFLKLK